MTVHKIPFLDGVLAVDDVYNVNQASLGRGTVPYLNLKIELDVPVTLPSAPGYEVHLTLPTISWNPLIGFVNDAVKDRLNSGVRLRKQGRMTFTSALRTYDPVVRELHRMLLAEYSKGTFSAFIESLNPRKVEESNISLDALLDAYQRVETDLKLIEELSVADVTNRLLALRDADEIPKGEYVYYIAPKITFRSKSKKIN